MAERKSRTHRRQKIGKAKVKSHHRMIGGKKVKIKAHTRSAHTRMHPVKHRKHSGTKRRKRKYTRA